MRFTKTQAAYALLIVCASARLMLQMAALAPYAGLDEVYHVARLTFVRAEHRNPTTSEVSVAPYLMRSIDASTADGTSALPGGRVIRNHGPLTSLAANSWTRKCWERGRPRPH